MKKVILKRLTLVNFKGEKLRTTEFKPDVTSIYGDNGLGKSRHFDAFIWLLFGKDKEDRKDYEVKTRVNGEELHKVECSVMGLLDVDGEEMTLKRSLVEDWVKPRGQVEQKYKGNHTECWWNDTPVNVSEYDKRVNTIVDSNLFKMITNPAFFVSMPWKLQREQLFQIAGTVTDSEIAGMKPEYAALLDTIGGKSFNDFKSEMSARKKRLKSDLAEIQPRIDQTNRVKPEAADFAGMEKQIEAIDKELAGIDESISSVAAAVRKAYDEQQDKRNRMDALQLECQQIVMDAKTKAQEEAYAANARRRELEASINAKKRDVDFAVKEVEFNLAKANRLRGAVDKLKSEQDALRAQWYEENGRTFNGETVCPHCGQELPKSMMDEAQAVFSKAKFEKCDAISVKGKQISESIAAFEKEIDEVEKAGKAADGRVSALNQEVSELDAEYKSLKESEVREVIPSKIQEWVAKQDEIESVKASLETCESSVLDTGEFQIKKRDLEQQRAALVTSLADRDMIERCDRTIADLESHGKKLAQQIADLEKEEYVAQEFTRVRIEESEKRINAMFKSVSFRLFDYTIDGNPVETCVPLVCGVPYGSANTAGQVKAGLDIINTICRFYGVSAPIFIDNRESVNEIIPTESQIINLVVTKDKELIVK